MGYVLLWIEHLAMGLLLLATLVACISQLKRPWLRMALSVLVALPALIVYALLLLILGHLRFRESIVVGMFGPLVMLTACYAIGVVWILFAGLRRRDDESAKASAWPRGKLALVTFIAVGLHTMTWWNLDLAVRQQLASLPEEASALALSVAPARIPDRDNAALLYEQTYEVLDPDSWSEDRREKWAQWIEFDKQFDPDDPELKSLLDEQTPTLILLRQAGRKPGCHFGRDYGRVNIATLLPGLKEVRRAAYLMALDARYRVAQGDVQTALEDVDAIFAMVEHVGGDLFLVSTLVAIAIDATATETLQEVLASQRKLPADKRITSEQLQAIDLDGRLSFRRLLSRALHAEMAAVLNTFEQICCGDPEWTRVAVSKEGEYFDLAFPEESPCLDLYPQAQSFYRMFIATSDVASYRNWMERFSRIAAKPYHEARSELKEFNRRFESEPKDLMTAVFMPALSRMVRHQVHGDARHRTARLALAAARYRTENGRLPESLNQLAPDYIPILPRDPVDGKPMRYRLTDEGAVIYSIGLDRKDDHGTPLEQTGTDEETGDITFMLRP